MEIIIKADHKEICGEAASIIRSAWQRKKNLVLGMATGRTPIGLYQKLIEFYRKGEMDFSRVVTFNLDEYFGLEDAHPQSFARYMDTHLFQHINIKPGNVFRLRGRPADIEEQCHAYERAIRNCGGIDIQILGIGQNGHIGFNEPGSSLASRTRLSSLTPETVEANAVDFRNKKDISRFCLTMGIGTILEARMILLLASGKGKVEILSKAIEGPITASVPASALQLHPNVTFLIDEDAAAGLALRDHYRWTAENKKKIKGISV
jgi:glucosamine-6-phosphate deaminase